MRQIYADRLTTKNTKDLTKEMAYPLQEAVSEREEMAFERE